MAETIKIQIVDDTPTQRDNPDLEDFFNGTSTSPKRPIFPENVDLDGSKHSWRAYASAQKRMSAEREKAENDAAYNAFNRKKAEPNFPDTVDLDGTTLGKSAYDAAQKRMESEKQSKEAQEAYDLLNPGKKKAEWMKNPMGQIMKVAPELAVVALAADSAANSIGMMAKNVNAVTDALGIMAGNERAGLGQLGDAATGAMRGPLEAIPFIGGAIMAQNDLTDAIVKLPEKLTAAFMKQADKISPYSGQIQAANARADVREIMADLREARGMGDSYARLIDAESRLDNTFREMLFPIKKFVVEVLADRLELLAGIAETVAKIPELITTIVSQLVKVMIDFLSGDIFEAIKDIRKIGEQIAELMKPSPEADLFDQFFREVGDKKFAGAFNG